jgi:hypothetical protein
VDLICINCKHIDLQMKIFQWSSHSYINYLENIFIPLKICIRYICAYWVTVRNKSMRTSKLFIMVATIIAAGFLVFVTTSNAAFAQTTSATSTCSISESNTQTGIVQQCNSCTSNTGSCNQLNINFNDGDAAQATSSGDTIATTTSNAASSTSLSNTQPTICTSGTSNDFGCNQAAASINFGNAVSASFASFSSGP